MSATIGGDLAAPAALLPALGGPLAGLLPPRSRVRHHVKHDRWTDEYDRLFRKYTKHYFGAHFDWHWFKAQAIAESALNPRAESPVGALGIMQILPSTYREIKGQNPFLANIEDPRWNIAAGIFYDRQLYRKWKKKRDIRTEERLNFAFGSYNAGYGNVLKAYRRDQEAWRGALTGRRSRRLRRKRRRHYVKRIQGLMRDVGDAAARQRIQNGTATPPAGQLPAGGLAGSCVPACGGSGPAAVAAVAASTACDNRGRPPGSAVRRPGPTRTGAVAAGSADAARGSVPAPLHAARAGGASASSRCAWRSFMYSSKRARMLSR